MKILKRVARVLAVGVVGLVCLFYGANFFTGHRLSYNILSRQIFTWLTGYQESPSGKYSVAVISTGVQGVTHDVYVARRHWLWPSRILSVSEEDFHGGHENGPEGDRLAMAWSADERYAALICEGWFVDYFDFDTGRGDSFDGLYLHTNEDALFKYHDGVSARLGSNATKKIMPLR